MLETLVLLLLLVLFLTMVVLMRLGYRFAQRLTLHDPNGWRAATPIQTAVVGLMTLLVAFTFSGAETRFEARRHLIVEEANAINTTYLRVDLLPAATQAEVRADFRRYVDSRISIYKKLPDVAAARHELERSQALQLELWREVLTALQGAPDLRAMLLLVPSMNQMFDLATSRTAALKRHPSPILYALLGLLALGSAFVAGMGMAKSANPHRRLMIGFSGLVVLTLAVILDFELPRLGLIRIDSVDQLLRDVRDGMN